MFDWLRTLLEHIPGRLAPFIIIDAYQNGGVLRFGKYHRTLRPGIHWKIPFAEEVNTQNVCLTTIRTPPQSLTTKDDVNVVVASIIRYRLHDVEPYICEVTDEKDVLIDVTMGSIRKGVMALAWPELRETPPEDEVLKLVRRRTLKYGFDVEEITFTQLAKMRSINLVQALPGDLAN